MNEIKPHKQKELVIKSAEIDEGIYDFVKWLNSFLSVETEFSCEGLSKEEIKTHKNSEKYKETISYLNIDKCSDNMFYAEVCFFCRDSYYLKIILDCIQTFRRCSFAGEGSIKIVVSYSRESDSLRYYIRFENKEHPSAIVEYYHNNYKQTFIERKLKFIP